MKNLWIRLGASLHLTDEECEAILGEVEEFDAGRMAQILKTVVSENRFELDGESYVPYSSVACFNDQYDTDYMEVDADCEV